MIAGKNILRFYFLPSNGTGLAVWLLVYLVSHAVIRVVFSDTLQLDDAEQVVLGQELALGYDIPQPPLYTWIYWLLSHWFGVGLAVLTTIKYTMITAMFAVLWQIASHLFSNVMWKIAAVLSFLLLHVFAWHMHVGFTHTIIMMLACAMTFHGFLMLSVETSWRVVAYLTLAITIGLLSKYGYHLFLLTLLVAGLSLPEWRNILLRIRPVLALAGAIALALPYHIWLYEHRDWIIHAVSGKFVGEHRFGLGWLQPVMAVLEYLFPLLLILLWIEPRWSKWRRSGSASAAESLLHRFHLLVFALLAIVTLSAGLEYFKARWMTPFLYLMPFWLLLYLQQTELRAASRLIVAATTLSLLIFMVRVADFSISPQMGREDRVHLPIAKAIADLPESCRQNSSVLAVNNFIAAHVRTTWPDKVVYSLSIRPIHPVAKAGHYLTVLYEKEPSWPKVTHYLASALGVKLDQPQVISMGRVQTHNQQTQYSLYCSVLAWNSE